MEADSRWSAIAIHPDDDVAVALSDCEAREIPVRVGDRTEVVALSEPVSLGHKIALRDLAAGALVRKYGEVIGETSAPIARGAHVHVHNLKSRRARADRIALASDEQQQASRSGRTS